MWQPDAQAKELLKSLGSAFKDKTLEISLDPELQTILLALAEITAGLDHFERCGAKPFKNLLVLLDNTDWAAHCLVSMPAFEVEGYQGLHENIWNDICRLSALLYIDIVVFPTPPRAGVKDTLSSLLYTKLLVLVECEYWGDSKPLMDVLFWATLVGAIAANGTVLEDSYTSFIADTFASEGFITWDDAQYHMKTCLWFSSVCDEPVKNILKAVGKIKSQTQLNLAELRS